MKRTDPYELPVPNEQILRAVFNLTSAEARLAQGIAKGDALMKIAAELGIKITTARTQLAVIFAKTGPAGRRNFVAILARLALSVNAVLAAVGYNFFRRLIRWLNSLLLRTLFALAALAAQAQPKPV
jgi:DNA-binding CsgD family transcriptional regulator